MSPRTPVQGSDRARPTNGWCVSGGGGAGDAEPAEWRYVAERAGFGSQESFRRHSACRSAAGGVSQEVQGEDSGNIARMSTTLTTTPAADGFRMPGEFERHSGTWLLWPERTSNWRLGAKPAQAAFAAVATAIATGEPVTVGASRAQFVHARSMLPDAIRVVEMSSDDSWMRDVGPTFVIDGQGGVRGVDWIFNAWGGLSAGLYSRGPGRPGRAQGHRDRRPQRHRAPLGWKAVRFMSTARHAARHRGMPAEPESQIRSWMRVSWRSCRTNTRHQQRGLAQQRRRRRDRRSRRQPVLFRAARRSRADLTDDKRDPQYRVCLDAYERLMVRDARSTLQSAQAAATGAVVSHQGRSTRHRHSRWPPGRPLRRAACRLLRQLLSREFHRRRAAARLGARPSRRCARSRASSQTLGHRRKPARSCSAAATSTASPNRCRRANEAPARLSQPRPGAA